MAPKPRSTLIFRAGIFLAVAFPLVVVAYQGFPLGGFPLPPILRAAFIAAILAYGARFFLRKEGRSLSGYGLSFSWQSAKKLLIGFAGGFGLFVVGAIGLRAALPFQWSFSPSVSIGALTEVLIYHLATNACEELAWRSFAFDSLIRAIGFWPAQAIVALVAACFHVVCGWQWDVALISTTAGSVLFGLVFFRWRSVPAALGVHSAWNWSRDLFFSSATGAAVLIPHGTETWTATQWNIAQGILVGVTIVACGLLAIRPESKRSAGT
jgi:membrane protease YdiL (CAAX protease family)